MDKRSFVNRVIFVVVVLACAAGLILVLGSGAEGFNEWARERAGDKESEKSAEHLESERIRNETMLVIGATTEGEATGFSYVRNDAKKQAAYEIDIRPDIVLPLPDGTSRILKELYSKNPSLAMSYLSSYLGIPPASWVVTSHSNYNLAIRERNPYVFLDQITKTSLSREDFLEYRGSLERNADKKTSIDMLNTSTVECGPDVYNEPHREMNAKFISSHWGVDTEYLSPATSVTVYNGTDKDGFGSSVAKTLLFNGFQINEITNAKTFDYDVTEIKVFEVEGTEPSDQELEKVKRLLGVEKSAIVKNLSDRGDGSNLAVYVGKDCTVATSN